LQTLDFVESAKKLLQESSDNKKIAEKLTYLVHQNDSWRSERCVNLHAAESAISPLANALLHSDLERRAITGEIGSRHSNGAKYCDEIEAIAVELAKKVFGCDFAELRPNSTSVADGIAIRCFTDVGDTIFALEEPRGHASWRDEGYAGMRGLKVLDIPFDYHEWNIDIDKLTDLVERSPKSRVFIVGTHTFLFPHPIREIAELARDSNAKVWYDGAHVLGLIAGGRFEKPLLEGADLLGGTGSKSFSGAMGGILLYNDEELDKKMKKAFAGHVASYGNSRLASLAITLLEWMEFGPSFADQIIKNARALARELDLEGFEVVARHRGYTESHTVLCHVKGLGGGHKTMAELEKANITCNAIRLFSSVEPWEGLRLGVSEMTRFGMKEAEMKRIAHCMREILIDRVEPEKVGVEVSELRSKFTEVGYCFSP
jgi:glycine hydroxymethyltransferase